jgi:hypothetical protein
VRNQYCSVPPFEKLFFPSLITIHQLYDLLIPFELIMTTIFVRLAVHRLILELFVKILPLWLLVMAVASGLIKLPFSVPFIDDLIM